MEEGQNLHPKIHCLTNPVSMRDTANVLLAAGGSGIMAQDPAEVEEVTSFCQAVLLNTGVPDERKFEACKLAGIRANALERPVVLDPVGVGASDFRRSRVRSLLEQIEVSIIRCNQEEACVLLQCLTGDEELSQKVLQKNRGGVESAVCLEETELEGLACCLGKASRCTVLISGREDVISDGNRIEIIPGGDRRMRRITGSGCMLSALCALFCGYGREAYEAAREASVLWKESARRAGIKADCGGKGIGSFHNYLLDAVEELCST